MRRAKAKKSVKVKRQPLTPAEREAAAVRQKAQDVGLPEAQVRRGGFQLIDVSLFHGEKPKTTTTVINRGGTPVARWKAAKLLSDSQVAAIDHCERLWAMLGGKSLVANLDRVPGGSGNGWAEQEALDDLARIKGYMPAKWWSVFESVCRFDEAAGFAGSSITDVRSDQVTAARLTVQFVADVVAMKEGLTTY